MCGVGAYPRTALALVRGYSYCTPSVFFYSLTGHAECDATIWNTETLIKNLSVKIPIFAAVYLY
jgi:hypothetical protein